MNKDTQKILSVEENIGKGRMKTLKVNRKQQNIYFHLKEDT